MFIVIPAKPFALAKTRLAPVLSPQERIALSRFLLQRTIDLARQVAEVVVVSRDATVRHLAKQARAWALVESGTGLNEALHQAATWATMRGSRSLMVLPADLPRLQLSDLEKILRAAGRHSPAVVIAPCRRRDGTNALFLRPPKIIPFAFGPGSFTYHREIATGLDLEPIVYHSAGLAFDLDLPEDWEWLKQESAIPAQSS
jgi:2-phospho-L-lactate guanylyltransferase